MFVVHTNVSGESGGTLCVFGHNVLDNDDTKAFPPSGTGDRSGPGNTNWTTLDPDTHPYLRSGMVTSGLFLPQVNVSIPRKGLPVNSNLCPSLCLDKDFVERP